MELIIFFLQVPIPEINDADSLKNYFIGLLILFIGAMFAYFKLEVKSVRDELKDERNYNRTQDQSNIKLLTEVNTVLSRTTSSVEGIQLDLTKEVTPIIKDNNRKIDELKNHLQNGR